MACLFALLAAASPRLALIFVWLFTSLVDRAFTSFVVPLLGLLFLPFATLMYVLCYKPVVGVTGWGWFWVLVGALIDVGSYGSGWGSRRRRARYA